MKSDQIFIGNIKRCTKYKKHITFSGSTYIGDQCIVCDSFGSIIINDEIYKENTVLLKIKNGGYVDLERLNSFLDYINIYRDITKNGFHLGGLVMSTSAHCIGSLFVDEKSLKPYYNHKQQIANISVRKLKKQLKTTK